MVAWGQEKKYELTKGHKEPFGDEGSIRYLPYGGGLIDIDLCQSSSNCTRHVCVIYFKSIILQSSCLKMYLNIQKL